MNCPIRHFQMLIDEEYRRNDIVGSTVHYYEGNDICSQIMNQLYTNWLLIKIRHHRHNGGCQDCT